MNACYKEPNELEQRLISILNRVLPDEYRYAGDGSFILGGKCPDFVDKQGKKKLIELYGSHWHQDDDPQNRIAFFKQFGFDTLVIWEHELRNEDSLGKRILEFNNMVTGV